MAHQGKAIAVKTGYLSLVPKTNMTEERTDLCELSCAPICMLSLTHRR